MISFNKVFFIIITIVIFWALIYNTYFTRSLTSFSEPYYQDSEAWVYNLAKNGSGTFDISNIETDSWTKVNYINVFDKVITYDSTLEIDNNIITLEKWLFIVNISELNNEYIIKWEWFSINTNWPTSLYIDNSWSRTNIFSLNSIVKLNLIDVNNDEVVNTLYLYPHEYLIFSPSKNKFIKNWDISLINKTLSLNYFGERIINDSVLNESFKNIFLSKADSKKITTVENIFIYLLDSNKKEKTILDSFKSDKFWTIIWENLIKEYNNLFLNDSKKVIYYKNLILRNIWDVINSNKINDSKNNFLIESLEELKVLSEKDYQEMKDIINYYSFLVINWNKDDTASKINFSKIVNKLNWKTFVYKDKWFLEINDLYFKYDFYWDEEIYNKLSDFNKKHIEDLESENEISYFIFYLNKIITYNFQSIKWKDIENILNIFDDYIKISLKYYSSDNTTRIRTWIEEYNDILKSLVLSIKNNYFIENIDDKDLLKLNNNIVINIDKIRTLESNIDSILKYYNNNQYLLTKRSKDINIKANYNDSNSLFKQYFLAIKDYDRYTAEYWETNKDFIFWETVDWENNQDTSITKWNARRYLSQFKYLDYSKLVIEIKDFEYCEFPSEEIKDDEVKFPYCYQINNLKVWSWVEIDFLLHPFNYNNINHFTINGDSNLNKWSYKLDNEELNIEEKLKRMISTEDAERYSFENFFLNVFNPPKYITEEIDIDDNQDDNDPFEDESIIVKVFKQNKLLWNKWDFNNLEWFINIEYDNLIVKEENNDFNIQVKNSMFAYKKLNSSYKWVFNSKYEFLPNHSFINPYFVLRDEKWNDLLNWNKIIFKWEIKVVLIKQYFDKFVDRMIEVSSVWWSLKNYLWITKYEIKYDFNQNSIVYSNSDFELIVKWNIILKLKYKWENISIVSLNVNEIDKTLKTLK